MNERISENVAPMPDEKAMRVIPDVAAALTLGAQTTENYKDGDGVLIELADYNWHLSPQDFRIASETADEIESNEMFTTGTMPNAMDILWLRGHADMILRNRFEKTEHSVAMLKDTGSSGWWRMVLPARYMNKEGWRLDCTAAPVDFDALMEYDTIFVQHFHDWESYYTLKRLHKAGKRIVYDIDDDIFNITPDNPAYQKISRDDQLAAARCMELADVLTVATPELSNRISNVVEDVEPVVIPNAWDIDDNWLPTPNTGSPDGYRRIFWSGGASHDADWNECFEAVQNIMNEKKDVRLTLMGHIPKCLESRIGEEPFTRDRIEHLGFRHPETYYEMLHYVRAEVGLAPVRATTFNACKTPIKFLEYSCAGFPTVATNWKPYAEVIDNGQNGSLVMKNWEDAIRNYLDNNEERLRTVKQARKDCADFDIKQVAKSWEEVLCVE